MQEELPGFGMVVSPWSKCGVLLKLPAKPQVFTIPGEHNVRKTLPIS